MSEFEEIANRYDDPLQVADLIRMRFHSLGDQAGLSMVARLTELLETRKGEKKIND